jgi:hypothetical protein
VTRLTEKIYKMNKYNIVILLLVLFSFLFSSEGDSLLPIVSIAW